MEYNSSDMAFDGSIIACITCELKKEFTGGKIIRIIQPEKDTLLLTVKKDGNKKNLLISVNPSVPLVCITDKNTPAPINAPSFCMLLRKHLSGGEIISVSEPSLERIIEFDISHFDEMKDFVSIVLTVELMGKYSNIILRKGDTIIDSIKRIPSSISSVREVLPGKNYFIPFRGDKLDPLSLKDNSSSVKHEFFSKIFADNRPLSKALYQNITGISPVLAEEILYNAGVDSDKSANQLNDTEKEKIYLELKVIVDKIAGEEFSPAIIYENKSPLLFVPFEFKLYKSGFTSVSYNSISELLNDFYSERRRTLKIRQKTANLRQIAQTMLQRNYKKYDLQLKQLEDTKKKDKFKLYGDLIFTFGYNVEKNSTSFTAVDYNTDKDISVPLDPALTPLENAKKYYAKYDKLKRTKSALSEIILKTEEEIKHLESILISLGMSKDESDISAISEEMSNCGYIKRPSVKKSKNISAPKSKPLHYISSDGFDIYVGKNNFQNEEISFKLAAADDWWFHAKNIPGSHVIVKCGGRKLPDKTFEEAASLAAHYSKANDSDKAEVDYTLRQNLKKPKGAKPGFVIYHTNYSMLVNTDISNLKETE